MYAEERLAIKDREQKRRDNLKGIKQRFLDELKRANLNQEDWLEVKEVLDRKIPDDWN